MLTLIYHGINLYVSFIEKDTDSLYTTRMPASQERQREQKKILLQA